MLFTLSARLLAALSVAAVAWVISESPEYRVASDWLAGAIGAPEPARGLGAWWALVLAVATLATPVALERAELDFDLRSGAVLGAVSATAALAFGLPIEPIPAALLAIWAQMPIHRPAAFSIPPILADHVDAVVVLDELGNARAANAAAAALFEGDPSGRTIAQLAPELARHCLAAPAAASQLVRAQARSGASIDVEATSHWYHDGEDRGVLVTLRDVRARQQRIAELETLALHDALTGLPNRVLLHDRLEQSVIAAHRGGGGLAVMMLDLNRFKQVNDTLGHQVGDDLLRAVAPRLSAPLRRSDTLARLGGDEFAVLMPTPIDADAAREVASRMVDAVADPFEIDGLIIDVGVSVGAALYPEHGADGAALLQAADAAMYVAKRGGIGFCVFDDRDEAVSASKKRMDLQSDLKRGIERDELELFFQPQIDTKTGALAGVEALMRWRHPRHGLLPPDQFIEMAEQSGLYFPLTEWLVNESLRQQDEWRAAGGRVPIALNLTPRALGSLDFPEMLSRQFSIWAADPRSVTFEVTEHAIMAHGTQAPENMREITAMGCRFAIDDFGTGFSSLGRLPNLPVHELKIDRSFIAELSESENSAIVASSIVRLAHGLGLIVLAEGVEDEATERRLAELGCDRLQGYRFGRPMAGAEFAAWLIRRGEMSERVV